jgi:hypothetical protein
MNYSDMINSLFQELKTIRIKAEGRAMTTRELDKRSELMSAIKSLISVRKISAGILHTN